jgi:hypothetical protein
MIDGTLTTWFNGSPIVPNTATEPLDTWFNGQPYTLIYLDATPPVASHIKTWNGVPRAHIKTWNGIPIANIKTWNGIA